MNRWSFNREFLKEKIKEGNLALQATDKNSEVYRSAQAMVIEFEDFLGREELPITIKKKNLEEMLNYLNHSLNINLNIIRMGDWEKIKELCKYAPKLKFKKYNSSFLPKDNDYVIKEILNFYKMTDRKTYEAVLNIIKHEYSLINIKSESDRPKNDLNFCCSYLSLPFVNVSTKNDLRYVILAHELRHAADYYLYHNQKNAILNELSAIYSEILFTDYISKYSSLNKSFYLYNERVNNIGIKMKFLFYYIEIFEEFDKCGRKLTARNYKDVLGVNTEKEFEKRANILLKEKYMSFYDYVMSMLYALQLREEYYNGNKKVNDKIEQILLGDEIDFDVNILEDKFIKHAKYVYSLSHK